MTRIIDLLLLAASLPAGGLKCGLPHNSAQAVLARRLFGLAKTLLEQSEDENLNVRPDNPHASLIKIEDGEMIWGTSN